jgi:hypothetical protein
MDKVYSARDVTNVIAKVEELATINAELEELLHRGSNDEKLVERKIELETLIRKYKSSFPNINPTGFVEELQDQDLICLKSDYKSVVSRYKKRKIELESLIRNYTNGNSD